MTDAQNNVNDENSEEIWSQPMPGESNAWYERFLRYLHADPATRSVRTAYGSEKSTEVDRSRHSAPSKAWYHAFRDFQWAKRAKAYDDHRRAEVFATGNASDLERIKKLDTLAEAMYARLTNNNGEELKNIEVNERYIDRLLAVFDSLAKHTGGYAGSKISVTSKDGSKIDVQSEEGGAVQAIFYVPEIAALPGIVDDQSISVEEKQGESS